MTQAAFTRPTGTAPERRLLLAGSWGPERLPPRPDPEIRDWYLPLHVRDERAARERIAAQIAAGADVVVAPTWLTHRRALLPLGETRRAGAWTTAAVRLARESVEGGLERRAAASAEAHGDDPGHDRPSPLVAASLPALSPVPDGATGRLLPSEAATQRDYRDQAGLLADAAPDLLLVEGQPAEAEARLAVTEALDAGLPVWLALAPAAVGSARVEGWLEWAAVMAVSRLILPRLEDGAMAALGHVRWGGLVDGPAAVPTWLGLGAGTIARLDGASATSLEPLRAAIAEHEHAAIAAARAAGQRWRAHVQRAAAMAPRGAALWLGDGPPRPLPVGFDWLVLPASEAPRLPSARFRLVVVEDAVAAPMRLLEPGGVLVGAVEAILHGDDARPLVVDDGSDPHVVILRRED